MILNIVYSESTTDATLLAVRDKLTCEIASKQAWKANVLFNHTDESHKKKGIAETLELCNADPPISDLDSLDILHRTLQKMDDHTELRSAIWERAAKAKPQDHALQMRWFNFGFEAGDWKSAQKVSWEEAYATPASYQRPKLLTSAFVLITGCHESSKELSSGAKVLFLGHFPLLSRFR